jgi:hypothetical protein
MLPPKLLPLWIVLCRVNHIPIDRTRRGIFFSHMKPFMIHQTSGGASVQELGSDKPNKFHQSFTNLVFTGLLQEDHNIASRADPNDIFLCIKLRLVDGCRS